MSTSSTKLESREALLERLRHSCAHVMAQAVQDLFPGTRLAIGPPIEDGFYYDFESDHAFVPEDLEKIEARMREIIQGRFSFIRSEHPREEAAAYFEKRGERFKVELIHNIPEKEVTYYQHNGFTDLCEGPHAASTADLAHFKLLKISGAYWRGDEKRDRLQRLYGTVWPSKEELEQYLQQLEEAKKRDHRELGPRLGLFTVFPEEMGPGLIFWLPKGAIVRNVIEEYWKDLHGRHGYQLTYMPHIARVDLWKRSGHWDFYRENMFSPMEVEGSSYVLKPMNCPGHIHIYKNDLHSYRELPIRFTELGTVYRFERSGVLHGLLRVRGFTQDDAHIFCRPDQLEEEIVRVLQLTQELLKTFGFREYEVRLSTRPEKYVGTLENWNRAEQALQTALEREGLSFQIDPGEGVFYGPKIDLKIKDCLHRAWQCSTVQVDFNLPERFKVTYRGESGKDEPAIMVHRALMGSLERFFGILIEHYAGAFPVWLAPIQAIVLTITSRQDSYAEEILKTLREAGIRAEADLRNEKINLKIREATLAKIPCQLVIGDREVSERTVSLRLRTGENKGACHLDEFLKQIRLEAQRKIL